MTNSLPVFVIHWNAPDELERSIATFLASEGVTPDITIIDNASEEHVLRRVTDSSPPSVRIERLDRNIGYAGAANEAIRMAREADAPNFVIAAHDILLRPDTLAQLEACLATDPSVGVVGPVLMNEDWSAAVSTGGGWLEGGGLDPGVDPAWHEPDRFMDVDWVAGALLLVRASCCRDVAGFRPELFAYCEDVDFCLRARDAGWRVGVWSSSLARETGRTTPHARVIYLIARNALVLTRRRNGPLAFLKALGKTTINAGRALGGSVAPWRGSVDRRLSREFFDGQMWAAIDSLRGRLGSGRDFKHRRLQGRSP